jgi:hypothetical protein
MLSIFFKKILAIKPEFTMSKVTFLAFSEKSLLLTL